MRIVCKVVASAVFVAILLLSFSILAAAQNTPQAALRGVITDPSGARIPQATVLLRGPAGEQTQTSDANGQYAFPQVAPGRYDVEVSAPAFKSDQKRQFNINGSTTLNVQLALEGQAQSLTVQDEVESTTVSTDPNSAATVIGKKELEVLSDDPDELARQLQALAGPGVGPTGGTQIYTDGFSGGAPPPKTSIREIRINSNPYSAEFDQPGNNRVEILTKPGGDIMHGQFSMQFNNEKLNSRSPLFTQSSLPPYKNLFWNGNVTGPIKKNKSAYTFDFIRRNITENAFILATNLTSTLQRQNVNEALIAPQTFTSLVPRFDISLNQNHTLTVRYENTRQELDNVGAGGFRLAETAFDQKTKAHTVNVTETALLNATLVNETRFQFNRFTRESISQGTAPSISVQDAFTSGSSTSGNSRNTTNRWEVTNLSVLSRGPHTLKWGARFRQSLNTDVSLSNFNGTFTFFGGSGPILDSNNQPIPGTSMPLTGLDVYQRTILLQNQGFTASQVRAAGGGASLFSLNAGNPLTHVTQLDLGAFFNDDWKLRPNLTFSYGIRYEMQTNIHDARDWSPRLGIAWGIDGKGTTPAKTVLRVGGGRFYQRVGDFTTLNAIRYNGVTQQSFLLTNPDFFPALPSISSLAGSLQPQTIQLLADDMQAPQLMFANVGLDRQINKYFRISTNYNEIRAVHFQRTRDVNARLPQTGLFPYGDSSVRMLTETTGLARQRQFVVNPNLNYKKLNLFGNYVITATEADFEGLPADHYNLRAEYARAFGDVRHRVNLGPTFPLPFRMSANAAFVYNSGAVYNITTGLPDPSGDGAAVQRPALLNLPASSCTGSTLRYAADFGCFDLQPAAGTPIIPKNLGRGPSLFNMSLRVSRTWDFVKREGAPASPQGAAIPSKYHLTLSAFATNPLNHPNFGPPNGNLASPFFGKPLSLIGSFTPGNATYNRKVALQAQLTF
jgi:hypothetical protein